MSVPYGFSEEDFGRVARSVRRSEGLPPRGDGQLPRNRGGVGAPHNFIYVTSNTLQTITLDSGTMQGYPAEWGFFDSTGGSWNAQQSVWFITPNNEVPTPAKWYDCHCVGADSSGQTIWAWSSPPATQTGLWNVAANPGSWSFSDIGSLQLLTLDLPGDSGVPWFIHFGILGRVSIVVGAIQHRAWCELDMSLGESIADPPGMISNAAPTPGNSYAPFQLVPVAFMQTAYDWFDNADSIDISGNEVYNNVNPYRQFSQMRNMNGIVMGGKTLSLSASYYWAAETLLPGVTISPIMSGIVDYAWIEAFQISPIPGGSGGGGGGGGGGSVAGVFGPSNVYGANGINVAQNLPSKGNVTIGIGAIDGGTWT